MAVGVKNFLVTQISKDGMMQGPDFDLYRALLKRFPELNLIASGGVSSVDDLVALRTQGLHGAIIGKAYYEEKITAAMMRHFRFGSTA
jgi:phosphoribosylformimino-5-aminoimidazole carboxamide ribotide isomerase